LPDVWGTADVVIRDFDNNRIFVDDHKFGHGVPVYSEDNPQLLTYLAGAVGSPATFGEYSVSIIQPPLDIYSTFELSKEQLEQFVAKLQLGITECKRPDAPFIPSTSACKFCPAKNNCPARYDMAVQEAKQVFKIADRMPDVSVQDKANLAKMLMNLEQVKKALFADIQATILEGIQVPGWKLVAGRSIRKWANQESAMKWMMENNVVDEDDMFTSNLISPSKAEKFNRVLKKSDEFKRLIIKPMGKPQLVAESDKRPDYDVASSAEDVFAKTN